MEMEVISLNVKPKQNNNSFFCQQRRRPQNLKLKTENQLNELNYKYEITIVTHASPGATEQHNNRANSLATEQQNNRANSLE
jgi:hypothetical protein|tara:strand:- start:284 stop:529 length:246 start_codon:yes stop_codon:yes gene_type:complete